MQRMELIGSESIGDQVSLLVYADESRALVAWFAPIDGARRLIGEEVFPRAGLHNLEIVKEVGRRAEVVAGRSGWANTVRVLERSESRMSLARYAQDLSTSDAVASATKDFNLGVVTPDGARGYTSEERKLLPYLWDAFVYSTALMQGSRAPAQAVAEARTISVRTAQSRIQRARKLGLLTPAAAGELKGNLTEGAADLLDRWRAVEVALQGEFRPLEMDGRK